ncbi:hypothetical protein GWN42_31235 [candidate division KSB1 bacterium]|nr:hypothetical protein [Phycisphaerae bacterium]NIQ92533.1 hypothetical protein [Deltaproteobacteria bacterium]NIV97143.1 hypothetical protein [candidate division KSB1 bacterium]
MKVWKDNKTESEKKKPAVALRGRSLMAVDSDDGSLIVELYDFQAMLSSPESANVLIEYGYDTSFAEWGGYGEMLNLLEDFE